MAQPQVKLIKGVDLEAEQRVKVPATDDRQFWIEQRHALLMQLVSIERRLGLVHARCRFCKTRMVGSQG